MKTEALSHTKIGQVFIRAVAAIMESRFRYRFFGPTQILQGADIHPGQTVLELGCGTGFFTIPAAQLIGDRGSLVAMDVLPASIETVSTKVQHANLKNVRVVKGDALNTGLDAKSMDTILLFGVLPAPMLPLDQLLPEMHRLLKPGGIMAVWPPSWVPPLAGLPWIYGGLLVPYNDHPDRTWDWNALKTTRQTYLSIEDGLGGLLLRYKQEIDRIGVFRQRIIPRPLRPPHMTWTGSWV